MNLQYRIDLLSSLGEYMLSEEPQWQSAKEKAGYENGWFIPEFVDLAVQNITGYFLQKEILQNWTGHYSLESPHPKKAGIIMAGNIPLVGFHDFLCAFVSGHHIAIKPSSKDKVLITHLVEQLFDREPELKKTIEFSDMLKGCDAYIATGSNNSSRYFDYYFGKYPHIIRRNRTSVALLTGKETADELGKLADDVYSFFGLGCRNVTKIYIPAGYDFVPLLSAFNKYNYLAEHHKYKNNYDYNLALHLLNKVEYMTNGSLLLIENKSFFSPISQLHYEYYDDKKLTIDQLVASDELQCIVSKENIPFGKSQQPSVSTYADDTDTLRFLADLR